MHVDYPKFPESNDAPPEFVTLPDFDKQKAFQFLVDNPNMMIRYKQLVPKQMTATRFFEVYYKSLFNIAYAKEDVLSVHRKVAMLRAEPVVKKAYEEYVGNGTITHSDFFRFVISRNRVDEGVDEQQLGDLKMDQLFEELKEDQKKYYKTTVESRLTNAAAAFDLRPTHVEKHRFGFGIHENDQLPYDLDIENPEKTIHRSSLNILQQINRRSDRLLNPSQV